MNLCQRLIASALIAGTSFFGTANAQDIKIDDFPPPPVEICIDDSIDPLKDIVDAIRCVDYDAFDYGDCFSFEEKILLETYDVPPIYVKSFDERVGAKRIVAAYKLGLSASQLGKFKDTEKRNGLLALTVDDYEIIENLGAAFYNPESIKVYENLMEMFDLSIIFPEDEDDIYLAARGIPDIYLVAIGGHGTPMTLCIDNEKGEKGHLDLSDVEVKDRFVGVKKVLLLSCSNGRMENMIPNLANTIHLSTGADVYSANRIAYIRDVSLDESRGFSASFDNGIDNYTYCPQEYPIPHHVLAFHRIFESQHELQKRLKPGEDLIRIAADFRTCYLFGP